LAVAGLCWNRDYDQFFKIYMKDSALHISSAGEADSILKPVTETSFHPADLPYGERVTITFEPAAQDKPRRPLEKFEDEKPDVYESVETFAPSTIALGAYPGEYVSEEIDPVYRIILQDGKLMLTRLKPLLSRACATPSPPRLLRSVSLATRVTTFLASHSATTVFANSALLDANQLTPDNAVTKR
jgi:hypothetical protein